MHPTSVQGDGRREAGLKVLVADGYRDAADTLALLLELGGHNVRVAYDGLEALGVARAFRPAVLIAEIRLPERNGYQLAREVRAELRDVRLIALTTMGRAGDRARSWQAGFDLHLLKPADPSEVRRLLETVSRKASAAVGDRPGRCRQPSVA